METVFPLPPCTVVRGYGIFHDISMGLETIWVVGEYLCWTNLQNFHIWISKGQGQSAVLQRGQLTCLKVKAIYHIWESMCFWRSRLVIWPPSLHSFYSFILIWNLEKSHQICAGCFGKYIFTKINPKSKWENVWNPAEKHCLLWAQRLLTVIWRWMKMNWLSTMCCDVMYAVYGCVDGNKCCVSCCAVVPLCYIDKPP